MTDVSVALCTHNGSKFIHEQIRSICLQSHPPVEIVLSDDASTDDCVTVAQRVLEECLVELPGRHIALDVIENIPALGVTRNFDQATRRCRSDLIALCDQDDIWHPHRLRRMCAEFERRPDLILLHTDARLVDAQRHDLGESLFHALEVERFELAYIHEGRAFDAFLRRNLVTGATAMLRRSLLDSASPFPGEWLHDEWLAMIAAAVGGVDVLEEETIDYRQHGGNHIGARRDTFVEKVRKAFAARGNKHAQRTLKVEILLDRLLELADKIDAAAVDKVHSKLDHQRFRSQLPAHRVARLLPVVREVLTGRYERFGRGARGIVRDLFESV